MLRLDLARLGREGFAVVEARVPAGDPLWADSGVEFTGPVEVRLQATEAGSGEIVVRGTVRGTIRQECRRCLEPVTRELVDELTMVFASPEDEGGEEDGDIRAVPDDGSILDLSGPVREEVLLAIDPYVVCDPECKGLCPRCGANWNTESCSCARDESDPRWDTLRTLKKG